MQIYPLPAYVKIERESQTANIADSETTIAYFETEERRYLLAGVFHPRRNSLPAVVFERGAEGAVAAVSALE